MLRKFLENTIIRYNQFNDIINWIVTRSVKRTALGPKTSVLEWCRPFWNFVLRTDGINSLAGNSRGLSIDRTGAIVLMRIAQPKLSTGISIFLLEFEGRIAMRFQVKGQEKEESPEVFEAYTRLTSADPLAETASLCTVFSWLILFEARVTMPALGTGATSSLLFFDTLHKNRHSQCKSYTC